MVLPVSVSKTTKHSFCVQNSLKLSVYDKKNLDPNPFMGMEYVFLFICVSNGKYLNDYFFKKRKERRRRRKLTLNGQGSAAPGQGRGESV